ncbi:MAG: carbohydrate-binding protein [Spirochaetales bacterium]|nr:carbohydrate-binding protein [Spirochaetales bacterium]
MADAKTALTAQVEALKLDNCDYYYEVVQSVIMTPNPTPSPTPVGPIIFSVPGTRIEAEDYTGSYDITSGNTGGCHRTDDVDIEVCSERGYNVGWIDIGDWLSYDINVTTGGTYNIYLRMACTNLQYNSLDIQLDSTTIASSVSVPLTGAWQNWTTIMVANIIFSAGAHTLRINFTGKNYNLNWIEIN